MAKNEKNQKPAGGIESGGATWGLTEETSAAAAYPEFVGDSRDAKDYVLVEKIHPEADGLRLESQVLKSVFEESDEFSDVSLDSDNVKENHPARNRPTSDLNEEERNAEGRKGPEEE